MSDQQTSEGLYVYCITRGDEPRRFSSSSMAGGVDLIYTVNSAGLGAVVSDSPIVEYERTRRNMIVHAQVQEEVMRECPILPVRFGTIAPDADSVRHKLLDRRRAELTGLFAEVENRVELGLKVFWNEQTLFQEIVAENPRIRALRDSLVGVAENRSYYDRVRLGEMVADAVRAKRQKESEKLMDRFAPLAYKTRTNNTLGERMVLNAAFLVDRSREEDFDRAVHELDSEQGSRLSLKFIGSAPPYNFVNILVSWDG